jgi:hypothetical protein
VAPDPYPSGIYSILPYPPVTESALSSSGAAPVLPGSLTAPLLPRSRSTDGPPAAGAVLARIGDIDLTATDLCTPAGNVPLATASVEVADDYEVRTPTWAMICAIVGFFVVPVLSLAFLLAHETVATGWVRLTVSGADVRHETLVVDPPEIDLARSLAAS